MFATIQLQGTLRQGPALSKPCMSVHASVLGRCQSRPRPPAPRLMQFQATYNGTAAVEEDITSLQNALVKHCVRVRQQRSYREEAGTVVLSGRDLVLEVAEAQATIKVLFVMQDAPLPDIEAVRVVRVPLPVMQKVTGLESVSPSTLAAEVAIPPPANFISGWAPGALQRLLVLERVQDPGNLGTLLRTALALGWQGALLLEVPQGKNCDPFNDKALRAGRGAAFKLPVASASLAELRMIASTHGMTCLAAEPHASPEGAGVGAAGPAVAEAGAAEAATGRQGEAPGEGTGAGVAPSASDTDDFERWLWGSPPAEQRAHPAPPHQLGQGEGEPPAVCLVLGSEGQGLSDAVLAACTPVAIPMPGDMESLNVAAAGAILMFALTPGSLKLQAMLHSLQHEQQERRRAQRAQRAQQRGGLGAQAQLQGAQRGRASKRGS